MPFLSKSRSRCIVTHTNEASIIRRMVADCEGVRPEDLPPLEEWIPLDVRHRLADGQDERSDSLRFRYLWYEITIHPSGEVTVTP